MRMITVPHGSWHHVVCSPATSAIPAVRNSTPRCLELRSRGADVVADHADVSDADPGHGRVVPVPAERRRPPDTRSARRRGRPSRSPRWTRGRRPVTGRAHPCRARSARPPCDTAARAPEAEDVGIPAGGRLDVGDADGGVGQSGQHRVSTGSRRIGADRAAERSGSAPAGDLVL